MAEYIHYLGKISRNLLVVNIISRSNKRKLVLVKMAQFLMLIELFSKPVALLSSRKSPQPCTEAARGMDSLK
jgi:hypothetical protein